MISFRFPDFRKQLSEQLYVKLYLKCCEILQQLQQENKINDEASAVEMDFFIIAAE